MINAGDVAVPWASRVPPAKTMKPSTVNPAVTFTTVPGSMVRVSPDGTVTFFTMYARAVVGDHVSLDGSVPVTCTTVPPEAPAAAIHPCHARKANSTAPTPAMSPATSTTARRPLRTSRCPAPPIATTCTGPPPYTASYPVRGTDAAHRRPRKVAGHMRAANRSRVPAPRWRQPPSAPAELHVPHGQDLAGGDPGQPLQVAAHVQHALERAPEESRSVSQSCISTRPASVSS